jgi:hypothetical protein
MENFRSISIFGKGKGKIPGIVNNFTVERNTADNRKAKVEWAKENLATGYVVNYGTDPNKLYTSVMVYDVNTLMLTGLNKDVTYYYSIDAFNESGITKGVKILKN